MSFIGAFLIQPPTALVSIVVFQWALNTDQPYTLHFSPIRTMSTTALCCAACAIWFYAWHLFFHASNTLDVAMGITAYFVGIGAAGLGVGDLFENAWKGFVSAILIGILATLFFAP